MTLHVSLKKIFNRYIFRHPRWFLLLVSLLLVSCGQNRKKVQFPKPAQLTGQPVEDVTVFTRGNVYLTVADTFLVVQKTEAPIMQIYSTNTHNLLAEFGSKGRGPGEFMLPVLLQQVDFNPGNNSPVVYVFDAKRKMMNTINIHHAIDSLNVTTQESLPSGRYWLTKFFHKDENFYFAQPSRNGRFAIHNYETSQDTVIPYIPKSDFDIPKSRLPVVYSSAAFVNVDKDLIAATSSRLGKLDFFDLKGNHLRSTIFDPLNEQAEKFSGDSDSFRDLELQIVDLDAKEGLIYGLNVNTQPKNLYNPKMKYNMKVQVFNWDGEPVQEYLLDNRMIFSIAFDPVHERIYAYAPLETKHNIITYSLQ